MDFSDTYIPDILFSAIPKRFQDFKPTDFEDFITQLFRDMGHEVEQTKYSGDFGADLILGSELERTVVQVKRYAETNKVGVNDVNQVIGSKEYYKAKEGIVVTTSSFTAQAKQLCHTASIQMWAWDDLLEHLCNTYFWGLDYFTFFEDELSGPSSENQNVKVETTDRYENLDSIFDFKLLEFQTDLSTAERYSQEVNLLSIEVTNKSQDNVYLNILLPDYVTSDRRQMKAKAIFASCFSAGVIYSGTSVIVGFFFYADQLTELTVNSKLVLNLSLDDQETFRYFIDIRSLEDIKLPPSLPTATGGMCFIVTELYGTDSFEYKELTLFRDSVLSKLPFGRLIVRLYYQMGPHLVTRIKAYSMVRKSLSIVVKLLSRIARLINQTIPNPTIR